MSQSVESFGSLLQLNPHGHAVIPDGLFAFDATGQGEFVSLPPPSQQELERLALGIVKALFRILERRAQNPADPDPDDAAIVQDLSAAAKLEPRCPPPEPGGGKSTGKGELAVQVRTDLGVFSLHAGTCVPAHDRKGLERLLRYGARPAFAHKRLSWTDAGKLEYRLRKPYSPARPRSSSSRSRFSAVSQLWSLRADKTR